MIPRSLFFRFIFFGLFFFCWIHQTASFSLPPSKVQHIVSTHLDSVATPHDEEQREKMDDDISNDWTEAKGGILPRVRRRWNTETNQSLLGKKQQPQKLITEISNLMDYKRVVVDCEEEIVVLKFYATWCRACKAMAPRYKRLAHEKSSASVKFVQVPVTQDNIVLHQGLGIPSVPFGHIYHKRAGLVEELKVKKKEFATFEQVLQTYLDGECELLL